MPGLWRTDFGPADRNMLGVVFAVALACAPVDMPPDVVVQEALRGNLPTDVRTRRLIFGSVPELPLPTEPSKDGTTSYAILVDPMFDQICFEELVDSVLLDERSWPGLRKAVYPETPQVWIRLLPPAMACGGVETFAHHCAETSGDGEGEARINYQRWTNPPHPNGPVADRNAFTLNHEVGHILGFEHRQCSVMGGPGYGDWAECEMIVWPSETEKFET